MGEILYFPTRANTARRRPAAPLERPSPGKAPDASAQPARFRRKPLAQEADRSRREPLLREAYGDVLREIRLDRGERLTDVAGRAAISPQYLSEIERGRKDASSEILASVARALGMTVRTLSAHVASRMSQGGSSTTPLCLAA